MPLEYQILPLSRFLSLPLYIPLTHTRSRRHVTIKFEQQMASRVWIYRRTHFVYEHFEALNIIGLKTTKWAKRPLCALCFSLSFVFGVFGSGSGNGIGGVTVVGAYPDICKN